MNLFGTDGIRVPMGTYPLTSEALPKLGGALAQWALNKYGPHATFLIASDTRASCDTIKNALCSAFSFYGIPVYDAGIVPTPAVFHRIAQDSRISCGLIISASHNKATDNGIKLVDSYEGKLTEVDEQAISSLVESPQYATQAISKTTCIPLLDAEELYCSRILSLFPPSFLKGVKLVIDCAHGATYRVAPTIFKALGADLTVINASPNGFNINDACGATFLSPLKQTVLNTKAFIGIAFDGDGDRFMGISSEGEELDGDDTLALLLTHPLYKDTSTLVSTVMANQGLEAHLKSVGKKLLRTPVGDKYILKALKEHALPLGGEPSGHTIISPLTNTGDGILVALKVLETVLITGNYRCKTFYKYPQITVNILIKEKKDLSKEPFASIITTSAAQLPKGRLLVRYSGTESLLRLMAEDEDKDRCLSVVNALASSLKQYLC